VELQEKKMSVIYSLLEIRDENVVLFDSIDQMLAYVREHYDNMFFTTMLTEIPRRTV
jgi:archaellum biogenesis ATPase FlaH